MEKHIYKNGLIGKPLETKIYKKDKKIVIGKKPKFTHIFIDENGMIEYFKKIKEL